MLKPKDFFTLLSDETRLRCLALLRQKGELCVCDLTDTLKMVQPKISRHLALLRRFKVVTATRRGTWMYYRLNPALPPWANQVISATVDAIKTTKPYVADAKLISSMKDRTSARCCN